MYCGHPIEESNSSVFFSWAPEENTAELYERWNSAYPERPICHEIESHGGSPYGDEPAPDYDDQNGRRPWRKT
jgi:hypothetical protein